MNAFYRKRFGLWVALVVLSAFSAALFSISQTHFFHDYLPENDDAIFARLSCRPLVPIFQKPVTYEANETCPFNTLLNFLEGASHLAPLEPIREWLPSGRTTISPLYVRDIASSVSHDARAPPACQAGKSVSGCFPV
jgi:hypothetical protein